MIKKTRDLFAEVRPRSSLVIRLSAFLLIFAASVLVLSSFGFFDLVLGQILFVVLVFSSATLLLITAISQDIRVYRGRTLDHDGNKERKNRNIIKMKKGESAC